MSVTHVVGVDPGLVHTGVVSLLFDSDSHQIQVDHEAVVGADADAVKQWTKHTHARFVPHVFIEKYQPRSHLSTDAAMAKAVIEMKQALPGAQVLLNTGVKKVIRKPLMELLGVWSFPTVTHHQDLRSAARIALLGMSKDEAMNRLLSDIIRDHLAGESWDVAHG